MFGIFLIFWLFVFLIYLLTVKEPIHAVFSFIVVVICLVSLLFLLNIEYIALMFLLIYVGAIIILFLFVIMMLNLRMVFATSHAPLVNASQSVVVMLTVFLVLKGFGFLYFGVRDVWFCGFDPVYGLSYQTRLVELFMHALYTDFAVLLLIVSYILLIALVGSILLTIPIRHFTKELSRERDIFSEETPAYANFQK